MVLPNEAATLLVKTFEEPLTWLTVPAALIGVDTLLIDLDFLSLFILPTSAPNDVTLGVFGLGGCCCSGCCCCIPAEVGTGVGASGTGVSLAESSVPDVLASLFKLNSFGRLDGFDDLS